MAKFSTESESFDELIVGFFEELKDSPEGSYSSNFPSDAEEESVSNAEESKIFWELQEELLQVTLCRTTSIETKIRKATKEALREMNSTGGINCICRKTAAESCRNCTQKEISKRLQIAGYNCVICKSKWRQSHEIPSGEHSYMEVMVDNNKNSTIGKGDTKIIIELNFRAQFEMARSKEEYDRLINRLPEVYVGKFSRLQNLIKILCAASKKCMKEKKMHMAPWRKHKYMLAKWQGTPELIKPASQAVVFLPVMEIVEKPISTKPRASMLTFDLQYCSTMIKVV